MRQLAYSSKTLICISIIYTIFKRNIGNWWVPVCFVYDGWPFGEQACCKFVWCDFKLQYSSDRYNLFYSFSSHSRYPLKTWRLPLPWSIKHCHMWLVIKWGICMLVAYWQCVNSSVIEGCKTLQSAEFDALLKLTTFRLRVWLFNH